MNRRTLGIVLGVLAVVITAVVLLLVSGGTTGPGEVGDGQGDAVQSAGDSPPRNPELADVVDVTVTRDGDEVVFSATLAGVLPERLDDGTVDYRWDVIEGGTSTWIVSADLNVGISASVLAQQGDFGASTQDETLPGSVEIDGETLTIRLQTSDIEDFPDSFEWTFRSTLDGDRSDPTSAVLEDLVPDSGTARFDG
jgi:hypothetical protein